MNLSKLTPAPWIGVVPQSATSRECWIQDANAKVHLFGKLTTSNASAIEFIALARNAFDVMMRRGWNSRKMAGSGWFVEGYCNGKPAESLTYVNFPNGNNWPDPFTALVEADKWFRENVELTRPSSPPPVAPGTIQGTSPNG